MSHAGTLGVWQGAGLLATTLLGTSVFILPEMTIEIAGVNAIWSWTFLTLFILPIALVFAKLSGQFPHAGGPANFCELAFGKVVGRSIGLIFLLVVPLGAPAALIMTFQFVDTLLELSDISGLMVQYLFLLIIYLLNIRGVSLSATIQLGLTLTISALVGILCLAYFLSADTVNNITPALITDTKPISTMFSAAALAFWSFLGIEAMAHMSSEFKDPKKDLVPAIVLGTLLVGVIYIACTFLVAHVSSQSTLAMVDIFDTLLGGYGNIVICFLGIAGGLATVNVYTASCSKLMWSFSHNGVLPPLYQQKNSSGTAHIALRHIVLLMALVLTVSHLFKLDLAVLVGLCNGVFVVIYLTSMFAAFKLLPKKYFWLASISIIVCFTLAFSLSWQMAYALILLIIVAPLAKRKHSIISTT
ncbi:L-methionine/branched-chain amino acid transporter [Psychrosphaera sp. 1_MG-2023]|uniref:L-methionine/branched-chain amino acid transporter n=1 Tax=Psychrosphaera sp. 1_MG-2023 TaxID=3062643 RepID=UPI0026E483AE|nr:L-methionine/branched-chain amino acid transporter [Psychrosphaera sp. 1_MG-2023]MDO6717822.1 L-methionine/branched-chain amino acid transporter [Psychrosphaera sp. 1_MG-2023]